jgi:uncharacterized protein (DUF111 family)
MKHARPAVILSVLCNIADISKYELMIFNAGLTFGIRKMIMQRSKLSREFVTVATRFGDIKIKIGKYSGKVVNAKPEFADCARAAETHNAAVKEIIDAALAEFFKQG